MNDLLRILLVEDYSADAELIKRELQKGNIAFRARCVDNPSDYVHELHAFEPDIVLSDFSLGSFTALDALHLLRESETDLPFILVTGSQSEEVAVRCIKEGADDYILKSSMKRLPSAVLSALKKKDAERERARAEAALRWREEYFRSLIEHSSDVITILKPDGDITFESSSIERILGYNPRELIGKNAFDYVHPDDVSTVRAAFKRALRNPDFSTSVEYRFRHSDGTWRILESIGRNMQSNPEVGGVLVNSRDITERKHSEERIREQAALLDKARDAILVHDLEGRVTYWNKSAEALYEWPAAEATGRTIVELFGRDNPDSPTARASRAALERGEWNGELHQATQSGAEIVVASRWTLVPDAKGRPKSVLVINTDITEKKKLEAQFLRIQRMESIGTLAGGIAHDLNNVLTPILLAIRMLRDEVNTPAAHEILNTLESSSQRGSAIVQQVLSFARGVEGQRTVVQAKHPLNEVIGIVKDTFPKAIQLQHRVARDLWPIIGDATQLHQVFMNICLNARDAMPGGGRLQIIAENVHIDENYAGMQADGKTGPHLVITISDTGTGIPPAIMSKIFEPFFTTKDLGKGTGLGLSTALAIIKSHAGFLSIQSEAGKGTRVRIHLPAAPIDEHVPAAERPVKPPRGKGEWILVAEDEVAVREIIKVTLENHRYKVVTANDGTEAVALFAQHQQRIAAAVVDIMMPYMDGPATMRALQKFSPDLRFVAVSGMMELDKLSGVSENGRTAFLAKPFTTEQLLTTLRTVLDAA